MRKKHAEHNESVCEFLAADGRWDDWVVTTAFYSAVHFIEFKLFPLKEAGTRYPAFEQYYEGTKKTYNQSPHMRRKRLVLAKIPDAYDGYVFLMDAAMTARYRNYYIQKSTADLAREHLKTVKFHCQKE